MVVKESVAICLLEKYLKCRLIANGFGTMKKQGGGTRASVASQTKLDEHLGSAKRRLCGMSAEEHSGGKGRERNYEPKVSKCC